MAELPEHGSPKAARILAAAGELLLGRGSKGVTIAEVATKAHVGKGTVYLYWKTKEDLLLGLISRDFIALADEVVAAVTADPELARPSRLGPNMLEVAARHPYVNALQTGDDVLLGVLADDPRSATLLETLGAGAFLHHILPIWRRHDLARDDWDVADQAFALQALLAGFLTAAPSLKGRLPVDDPARVFAASITALLGPERATPEQVKLAAEEGIRSLEGGRSVALDIISG